MKKLFAIFTITGFLMSCNNETKTGDSSADTAVLATPAPDTSGTSAATPMKDSVMQFKDDKVMIMLGGSWMPLSATVTTTNGRKVNPNGEVSKGEIKRKMEEGMMIDKDGQLMDKDGKPMDNTGWE